jgi:hypothetical protein
VNISIADVRSAVNIMLDLLVEDDGDSILLESDLYWAIPWECIYDVEGVLDMLGTGQFPDMSLGSLYDDVAEMHAIGRNEREPLRYALKWASAVLYYLGTAWNLRKGKPALSESGSPPAAVHDDSGTSTESRGVEASESTQIEPSSSERIPDSPRSSEVFEWGRRAGHQSGRRATLLEIAAVLAPTELAILQKIRNLEELDAAVKALAAKHATIAQTLAADK